MLHRSNDEMLQALSSALVAQLKNSESLCQVISPELYSNTQSILESIAHHQNPATDTMVSYEKGYH
jgi:hypothetical protein